MKPLPTWAKYTIMIPVTYLITFLAIPGVLGTISTSKTVTPSSWGALINVFKTDGTAKKQNEIFLQSAAIQAAIITCVIIIIMAIIFRKEIGQTKAGKYVSGKYGAVKKSAQDFKTKAQGWVHKSSTPKSKYNYSCNYN